MRSIVDHIPLIAVLIAVIVIIVYVRRRKDSCIFAILKRTHVPKFSIYNVTYPYSLPALSYDYNALEPYLDAETLTIHHTKHHQSYIDNLNAVLVDQPNLQTQIIESLLSNLEAVPLAIRDRVRNNAGGHFSHMLFWDSLSAKGGGMPSESLMVEINKSFGSFQTFKAQFEKMAQGHVGSGWVWLVLSPAKKLEIMDTLNHDTPLAQGAFPLLVLDVWEHAYYLKYRNMRVDFISAWWNVVNWEHVEKMHANAMNALK